MYYASLLTTIAEACFLFSPLATLPQTLADFAPFLSYAFHIHVEVEIFFRIETIVSDLPQKRSQSHKK